MHYLKLVFGTIIIAAVNFHAQAQDNVASRREIWVEANLSSKQDAIDFITTAYKDFTVLIAKRSVETGVYKRTVKFNDCELIIETEGREQQSSWPTDRDFTKSIVVIDFDKVVLDGDSLKPSTPENAAGLFAGRSNKHFHKLPSYSILDAAPNRDTDNDKFARLHYEEHLQWAYQYLIERCSAKK